MMYYRSDRFQIGGIFKQIRDLWAKKVEYFHYNANIFAVNYIIN